MIFNPIVPKMEPTTYISSLTVGSSVWCEVNGTRTELLIVNQGNPDTSLYDVSCDGTWCLLKDIYSLRVWSSNGRNSYSASDINTWLTQTFSNYLPSIVKTVKIPYVNGYGSTGSVAYGSNGLEVRAFLLGGYELGWLNTDSTYPVDGKKLDYFDRAALTSTKRVAYYSGSTESWQTRSPDTSDNTNVFGVTQSGDATSFVANGSSGVRPAFILPFDTKIDKDNNIIAPQ